MNSIVLVGRLTRDPELKYTPSGLPVAHFTLAVDRPFKAGEKKTDFVDCVAWRKLAEIVANHLTKGSQAAARGRLQIRSYETQDGQRRKVAEVVVDEVTFVGAKKDGASGRHEQPTDDYGDLGGESSDEVPF